MTSKKTTRKKVVSSYQELLLELDSRGEEPITAEEVMDEQVGSCYENLLIAAIGQCFDDLRTISGLNSIKKIKTWRDKTGEYPWETISNSIRYLKTEPELHITGEVDAETEYAKQLKKLLKEREFMAYWIGYLDPDTYEEYQYLDWCYEDFRNKK